MSHEVDNLYWKASTAYDGGASRREMLQLIKPRLCEIADGKAANMRPALLHPLGFITLDLIRSDMNPNLGLVVHKWPISYKRYLGQHEGLPDNTTEPFHQHSFDLRSMILAGAIEDQRAYVNIVDTRSRLDVIQAILAASHRSPRYHVFNAKSGLNGYDQLLETPLMATYTGFSDEVTYEEGQKYSMQAGEFHVSSYDRESITLMLSSNYPNLSNLTVGKRPWDSTLSYTHYVARKIYSPEQTISIAGHIATELALDH